MEITMEYKSNRLHRNYSINTVSKLFPELYHHGKYWFRQIFNLLHVCFSCFLYCLYILRKQKGRRYNQDQYG